MYDSETKTGELVTSTNQGRYAIGDAQYGPDLSGGTRIEVKVGRTWVAGRVEHGNDVSVGLYAIAKGVPQFGYFVLLDEGGILGLCTGMEVRLESR